MTLLKIKEVVKILEEAGYKVKSEKKHLKVSGPNINTGEYVAATLRHVGGKTGAEIPEHIVFQIRNELGIDLRHAKGLKLKVVELNKTEKLKYLGVNRIVNRKWIAKITPDKSLAEGEKMPEESLFKTIILLAEVIHKGNIHESVVKSLREQQRKGEKKEEELLFEKDIIIEKLQSEIKVLRKDLEKTEVRKGLKKKIERGKRFTHDDKREIYVRIMRGKELDARQKNYLRLRRITEEEVKKLKGFEEFLAIKCVSWSKWKEEDKKKTEVKKEEGRTEDKKGGQKTIKMWTEQEKRRLFEKIKMGSELDKRERKYLQNRGLPIAKAKGLTWLEFLAVPTFWSRKYSVKAKQQTGADNKDNQ